MCKLRPSYTGQSCQNCTGVHELDLAVVILLKDFCDQYQNFDLVRLYLHLQMLDIYNWMMPLFLLQILFQ